MNELSANFQKQNNYAYETSQTEKQSKLQKQDKKKKAKKEKDIYKDTPVRSIGFLDEFGEALRPVLSTSKNPVVKALPNLAYIPAMTYIALDVADKYKKGEDGTGKKPSAKMAAREAAYQGLTSVVIPMTIIRGGNSIAKKITGSNSKASSAIKSGLGKVGGFLRKSKKINSLMDKASLAPKLGGAFLSLFLLSKLAKPADWAVNKIFEKTVDPLIGINKTKDVRQKEENT